MTGSPTTLWVLLYLDPGSGSWMFQMIIAGVVSSLVFIKYQGQRILSVFRRKEPENPEDASDAS